MTHRLKFIAVSAIVAAPAIQAQNCNLSEYKPSPGLTADAAQKSLALVWDGEKNDELRLRLSVQNGTPVIQDVALRHKRRDIGHAGN